MRCVVCKHGDTKAGHTTITLERAGTTLVIKGVPARICDNCGEAYVDEAITIQLMELAEAAFKAGVQIEVRQFIAA